MPFPDSRRVVFEQNTLAQVITQLQFPSILSISASPIEFQERIRGTYPIYKREAATVLPAEMAGILQQMNLDTGLQGTRHSFATVNSARAVTLTQDFLALQEQRYTRWEDFFSEVNSARTAFEEIYKPAPYGRIGLRYINVFDRTALGLAGTPWASLMNSALVGILTDDDIHSDIVELMSVAIVKIEAVPGGRAIIRYGPNGDQYTIDADFFTTDRSANDDINGTLDRFNRTNGNLYRWAITPILRDALRPIDGD